MATQYCGLDVSPTSLKAVILEQSPEGPVITSYDEVTFNGGTEASPEGGEINPGVKEGLLEFSSRHRLRGTFTAASLPTHTTFNRAISLPPVDDQRAQEIIQYEAQQNIPFPLDSVIWDYQKVDRAYEEGEEIDVVLFAIKKDIVNEFIEDLNDAGIDVDIIQFAPVALYNFIQFDQPVEETTAVLDLGKNNCDLIIIEGDRYWIRDVPIAANDFTQAIQERLQVPFDKAEQLKREAPDSPDAGKFYQILEPVYQDLVQEIHRSIGFYKSKSAGSSIEQIYLMGGGAKTLSLKEFISENMQLSASIISSMETVDIDPALDDSSLNQTGIGPAVGLALQGMGLTANEVNLLPERVVREKELQKKRPFVVTALVLFALAAAAFYYSDYLERRVYRQENEWGEQKLAEIKQLEEKLNKLRKKSSWNALKNVAEQSVGFVPNRQFPVKIWDHLTHTVPDNEAIRNRLQETLEPFYRRAGKNGLPSTYSNFRTYGREEGEELPGELKKVRRKARRIEKEFLFLLDVDFHYTDEDVTSLDVYCAVVKRDNPTEGYEFVRKTIYDPLRETFRFQDLDQTGPSQEGTLTMSELTSFLNRDGEGGGGFGGASEKNFSVYRVHFQGKTSELNRDGTFVSQE